jgi:hypothetical protein
MAMPSGKPCLLAYLLNCQGEVQASDAPEVASILERAARKYTGARPARGTGVCELHHSIFGSRHWSDSAASGKVSSKAVCAGCLGRKGKRLRKRKPVFMQPWNNHHPLAPLPAGSVFCGKCVSGLPETEPDTIESPGPPPSKRLKAGPAWTMTDGYDSDPDSDSLAFDPSDPDRLLEPVEPVSGGESEQIFCQGNWDPEGCLQDSERPCLKCVHLGLTLCSRCIKWTNWTCMRCFTPFSESHDPNHRTAAEKRKLREAFERYGDDDSITIQSAEPAVVEQPIMVDEPVNNWTAFPILEETEDCVRFIDVHGNQCSLPPRQYHERCEIIRMVDRRARKSGDNQLREHTMRRMLSLQEDGHFKGLLGDGSRLKTVSQLQVDLDEMKRMWADEVVQRQAAELREQKTKEKLNDKTKRLKSAKRAVERRERRINKVEKQLETLNSRLEATLSEDGKLALVIDYIKSQIFGTKHVCLARSLTHTHRRSLSLQHNTSAHCAFSVLLRCTICAVCVYGGGFQAQQVAPCRARSPILITSTRLMSVCWYFAARSSDCFTASVHSSFTLFTS